MTLSQWWERQRFTRADRVVMGYMGILTVIALVGFIFLEDAGARAGAVVVLMGVWCGVPYYGLRSWLKKRKRR